MKTPITYFLVIISVLPFSCQQPLPPDSNKFDLGDGDRMSGFTQVKTSDTYSSEKGFGLFTTSPLENLGSERNDGITSRKPFYFAKAVAEGNYRVTVTTGNPESASNITIKAESRRLMEYDLALERGEVKKVSFLVHIRQPQIAGTEDSVRLKSREFNYPSWDNRLSLEFGGENVCVQAIEIERVNEVPVVFLTGNSTVVDQAKEPWGSWGQMFPVFFKDEVVIANHAESGLTLKEFIRSRRLEKIGTLIKPGDYLFMEFAHNDQKPGGNHVEPYTTYQEHLIKFANFAKEKGAIPVFVTSTNRRVFDENGAIVNTLGDYPNAVRQLADSTGIGLIDLNAMTKTFYEALGPVESKKAFVHYPANTFEDQPQDVADDTHFSSWGAYQLAKCVVEGLKQTDLPLKNSLKENLNSFDPAMPDSPYDWNWPVSPLDEVEEFEALIK